MLARSCLPFSALLRVLIGVPHRSEKAYSVQLVRDPPGKAREVAISIYEYTQVLAMPWYHLI
jgi:hypothetical protein